MLGHQHGTQESRQNIWGRAMSAGLLIIWFMINYIIVDAIHDEVSPNHRKFFYTFCLGLAFFLEAGVTILLEGI